MALQPYQPIIALAPMDGITDLPFRTMIEHYSPKINLIFTEFVNVQGLFARPDLNINRLWVNPTSPKVIAQFFGSLKQLEYFELAVEIAKQMGFDGVDLNLGCPDKNILRNESGSGLIGRTEHVKAIIQSMKKAVHEKITDSRLNPVLEYVQKARDSNLLRPPIKKFSLSLKTRLGIDCVMDDKWWEFLDNLGVDFVTIHGRTVKQRYSGSANWQHIRALRKKIHTPIIGNGDILAKTQERSNPEIAIENKLKFTPFGVMIGRGLLGRVNLLGKLAKQSSLKQQLPYIQEHLQLCQQFDPKHPQAFKKHILWYLWGIDDIKELKTQFMACQTYEEMSKILRKALK